MKDSSNFLIDNFAYIRPTTIASWAPNDKIILPWIALVALSPSSVTWENVSGVK